MSRPSAIITAVFVLLLSHLPLVAQNRILADIPIELARNKTIIPVTIGASSPLRLILDSGMHYDGILIFDREKVDLNSFKHLVEVQLRGAGQGGATRALSDDAATFSIGPLRFEKQRVTILATEIYKGFPTDGVIGYSLLGHYAVEIDYDRSRMLLYEPTAFSPVAGWESIDLYFKDNRIPWTDIRVVTTKEEPAVVAAYIDFASGEAVELLERETNAFTLPATRVERLAGRGLSGDIHGKDGRLANVCIGSFVLKDVAVLVVPATVRSRQNGADAIIGSNTLRRFNLIFDYAHHKLHLRPNRYFAEPFP